MFIYIGTGELMGSVAEFLYDITKAFITAGFVVFVTAVISLLVSFIFDIKNIRQEGSYLSSGVGNALLTLHTFLEPGRKPQTEQVFIIKRKRTPEEKKVKGLGGIDYYNLYIKGFKRIDRKRFKLASKNKNFG
ncbi:MAG: hypothetical protein Q8942_17145 [Bacillota bacterium]|nr:hypothetical protein [Bacillota bacterium]